MKATETPPAVGQRRRRRSDAGRRGRRAARAGVLNVFSHGMLVIWAVMVVMPLLWAVMTSFKDDNGDLHLALGAAGQAALRELVAGLDQAHMSDYFLNTILVVGGSLIGTLLLGSMAAYVLARFDFPGNRFIYFLFIGGMSFPIMLALVPLFYVMNNMGLLNTLHGLILVYIAYSLPFTVFFLTSFFRTLPTSVAEAALVDGASHTRTFFQIMLPMAKPGLISVGIFNFLGQWNQYMLPTVLNTDPDKRVLTQGLVRAGRQPGLQGRLVGPLRRAGDGDAAGARGVHRLPAPGGAGLTAGALK